jgi:TolB-like protein
VFLSYASEDRPAAQSIRDALRESGLEVWYDESALDGGDAWDQKIRRQIRECDFFMPLISAQTEVRPEGYFRREWRLAVERTLDMADDHPFLLPVVLDDTPQAGARVPERFLWVQWMKVPGGRPTPALEALCRRLVSGQPVVEPPKKRADRPASTRPSARTREYPQFPREEAGQKVRFWAQVVGWALQSGWVFFKGFPRWVQIVVYAWLAVVLMSRGCMPSEERRSHRASSADVTTRTDTSASHEGSPDNSDLTDLGSRIAREVNAEVGERLAVGRPLLVTRFSAPSDDPAAKGLADATFAQVYGKVKHSHRGQVGMTKEPVFGTGTSAAVEQGRMRGAKYVLVGAVDKATQSLTVRMVSVADGSLLWSESYPVVGTDPARIAAEVDSKLPSLGD